MASPLKHNITFLQNNMNSFDHFLTLLILSTAYITVLSDPRSNLTDQLSLLHFKNQLTGPDNALSGNWTANTSFCSWIGITCSRRRQRVLSLSLPNMNLRGTISPSLSNLSFLVTLNLSSNRFTGSIPPSVFNLSSLLDLDLSNNTLSGSFLLDDHGFPFSPLEAVDLSHNNLTGEIPTSLCRFGRLKSLVLSYNNLTGRIPDDIGCLSRLESLYATGNGIAGTIPPSLGNISTLRFLGLVENNIGGGIPPDLGKLLDLEMLGFDYNNLSGEIPQVIFNLSSLVYIAFTSNSLSGRIPETTGLRLPNLEGIFLADNSLRGEIPRTITNATKLKELELSYNSFVGTVPNDLGNLKELSFLNLAGNRLTNEPGNDEIGFFKSLVECKMLQFVILGNNPLFGTLPDDDSFSNLSRTVEMFNIENGEIYGRIPRGIGNMSSMTSLVLNGNNLTGNIPSEIGYLTELQRLYLSENKLQGRIPVELCDLVNLGEIILSENNLSESIPSCIGNLGRLQRLMLGYNRLNSSLPSSVWEISGLLFLNISNNMIQGEISSEIGRSRNLEGVDLSSNNFSSVIPITLGELQNLRYLSLSKNSIEGSIPDSLGNLMSLELLDLSENNLSGGIPLSLEKLTYLRAINVSYNRLRGEIPNGGVFLNSSPSSFVGNEALCSVLSLAVPPCSRSGSRKILKIIVPVIVVLLTLIIALLLYYILRGRKKVKLEDAEVSEIQPHIMISYSELSRATNGFSSANLLGKGGSGSVFKGVLSDETIVAVKVLNLNDEESKRRFDAECEILKNLRHRNLVKVITTCSNDSLRAIVLPYMPNGSLESWLGKTDHRFLGFDRRVEIMLEVGSAVEYLHHGYDEFPVVHCDLKPANVLLDSDMVAHVSDFGISKILAGNEPNARTKTLGTIGYIAPEYGSDGTVSTAGDVYSFGIMLMEVFTGRKPTDESFGDDLSLRQWVKAAYPDSLMEVVDANIYREDMGCLQSVMELSFDCSKEASEERLTMKDAVIRLTKIKEKLNLGNKRKLLLSS